MSETREFDPKKEMWQSAFALRHKGAEVTEQLALGNCIGAVNTMDAMRKNKFLKRKNRNDYQRTYPSMDQGTA